MNLITSQRRGEALVRVVAGERDGLIADEAGASVARISALGLEVGLPDRRFDLGGDVGIGLEEGFGVLAVLADALAVIGEPGARLLPPRRP